MIATWSRLSANEKRTLLIGVVIVGLVVLYQWTWLPLTARVIAMQGEVSHLTTTLATAQAAHLTAYHAAPVPQNRLAWQQRLRETLQAADLISSLTQLNESSSHCFELHFHRVAFDRLMQWLMRTSHTLPLSVKVFSVEQTDESGLVNAIFILGV
jgi:type II secretory pathway component PulM